MERDEWLDGGEKIKQPLVFCGRLEEEDVGNLQRYRTRLTLSRKAIWSIGGLGTILLVLGMVFVTSGFFAERDTRFIAYFISFIGMVLLVSLFLQSPSAQAWQAKRHYRRFAEQFRESEVTLTTGRVAIQNEAMRTESRWDMIGVIGDTPAGLLFCGKGGYALFWLPNRVLEGDNTRDQVLALAESNGVRIQRVE